MGANPSKAQLLYEQVKCGDVEGIMDLHREGAGVEWIDKEGKTPLILACTTPDFLQVVRVLIDLGANVNARSPGYSAGTPLHHAARRGFVQTVELLLGHGANPLLVNDGRKTPLNLARANNHLRVVRLIESRICLFAGWLRELYGLSILGAINPQWVSRKIWAVILPCGLRRHAKQPKYKLAIYYDLQVVQPNCVIPLWKVQIMEPDFNQPDPALVIVDKATKKRYKFLSENEGGKQQLQFFHNACKGIPQHNTYFPTTPAFTPMSSSSQLNPHASATSAGAPPPALEDVELAMAINASIQSAITEGVPLHGTRPVTEASNFNGWGSSSENATHIGWGLSDGAASSKVSTQAPLSEPTADPYNGWVGPETTRPEIRPSGPPSRPHGNQPDSPLDSTSAQQAPPMVSLPSAPPIVEDTFYAGPIHYPSIDSSPVDLTFPAWEVQPGTNLAKEGGSSSSPIDLTEPDTEIKPGTSKINEGGSISGSCVICLDAPAEGACIPCGHVAGCMSCLKEIKAKKWGCPVCRAKIDQVIKLYAV